MEAMIGSVRILGGCALLSFVALASTQEPAAGAAKPDRSAEARLREVFREMGKLRSAAFRVDRISREESSLPWMLEGSLQGVVEGESFWVEATDTWGGGRRLVSDGTTLLVDFLDKGVGVALRDAKPAIYANDESLAMRGEASSPLFYFLAGEKGFEELVAKEGEIVAAPKAPGLEAIRLRTAKLGTLTVFFSTEPKLLVRRMEFDNLEWRREQARMWAEWGAVEPRDPLEVHSISYLWLERRVPKGTFATAPPKGMPVKDERKQKP
jgi:hypothetical protein